MSVTKRAKTSTLLTVTTLLISACGSRPAPAPVIELYQGKNYRDFEQQGYQGNTYKVKKGDTLFSIAWYTGKDYRDIARLNSIAAPYRIYPGQQLRLTKTVSKTNPTKAKETGQTSKINTNQAVDPPKKQAYGESQQVKKRPTNGEIATVTGGRIERWMWPAGGKVIGTFSANVSGSKGIEISGTRGDAVRASADGKVVYTGDALRGYGQLIIIKHSDSFLSAYAHNERILVKEQQMVKAGQTIASMGSSGTDSVKLRFEVRYKGKSVDPLRYLPRR